MQALPLALMAGGSLIKGVAGFQAGKANRSAAAANAREQLLEGNVQASRIRQVARIRVGQQFGAQAESGFMVNQGSAMDNLVESQTNAEIEAMDALRTAQSRANADRAQGDAAYDEGKFGLAEGLVGAASSVAGGLQDYATAKKSGGY